MKMNFPIQTGHVISDRTGNTEISEVDIGDS